MFEKLQWRSAWASEMNALGHMDGAGSAGLSSSGPVSDRFFRMWRVTVGWKPMSAADFLAANRGQVQVALAQPRSLRG